MSDNLNLFDEPDPFDPTEATRQAEIGIQRSEEAAAEEWKADALSAVYETCKKYERFSSDEVWETFIKNVGQESAFRGTHNLSAMGGVMREAARQGFCTCLHEWQPGKRIEHHKKPIRVWKSLIFGL